ncbi:unnamed protein product [Rotaria sordida]|uniref:Mixed lineage kinase domain-containing protein n=1 Tax=Rotaria sordida TaxID=392033 RepID=A0A819R1K5_9BILA|nr:unnamed protein product [Rotaria sordida]CAF4034949.1 unnamed protein product [Rotaria sordida]
MAAVATEAVFDVSKVALNLGSKCVPSLVKAIFTSAKEIRETVRRINNCDEQCVRLSKRIDRLSDVLQKQQFPDTINESIEQALQDFEDFLEKCLDEQSDIINEETIRLIYDKDRKIFCGMMYPREATTQEAYESSRLFEISIDDPW